MSKVINQFVDQVDDTKINITANGLNKPLSDAINDGDIGAGAAFKFVKVGHGLSILQNVYHDGVDWVLGKADQATTLPLYLVTKVDGDTVTLTKFGKAQIPSHGLIVGEYYFASQTIAGAITSAEPTAGYSCPVLFVEDANNVHAIVHRPSLIGTGPGDDSEIGSVVAFGTDIAPSGFLFCDGSPISRVEYAELFAVVGVRHGSGDGSTTFNLPDLQGRFLRGWSNGSGVDVDASSRTAPATGGASGDNVGSRQADAIRNITGALVSNYITSNPTNESGALKSSIQQTSNRYGYTGGTYWGGRVDFNASNSVPTASDNRPLNTSVAFYIRYSPKPMLVPDIQIPASGGGSFVWEASGDIAPITGQEEGVEYFGFDSVSGAELYATVTVPDSYVVGDQIILKGGSFFSAASSGDVRLRTETKLLKPGATIFGSLGSIEQSTNLVVPLSVSNRVESIGDCPLTTTGGTIAGINVEAGDLLLVKLIRDSINETSSAAGDANFIKYSATIDFSGA